MNCFEGIAPTRTVDILGTTYRIYADVSPATDPTLTRCDGYCDKTAKRIVTCDCADTDLERVEEHKKYCLRHEIIHAFLFESGIGGCVTWDVDGEEHPEHMVEWVAIQFPKLLAAFDEAGAL